MNRVIYFFWVLVCAVGLGESPPSESVQIKNFSYSGSGCSQGSVSALLSPDREAVTLLFDDYVVDSSDSPSVLTMRNCNISFNLSVPSGWEYALLGIEYRGYADLEEGVSGYHSSQYGFGGLARRVRLGAMELEGPFADDYVRSIVLPVSERNWSSCQGGSPVLHLNTQLWVKRDLKNLLKDRLRNLRNGNRGSADRPEGLITLDSLDGHVMEDYKIEWRRCAAPVRPVHPQRPPARPGRGR